MAHVVNIEEIPDYQAEEARPSEVEATPQRKNILPLKILCILLVLMVSLGWVGIIVQLIMKEEWQLVMVAWLLLYAAAHFCYWYCRRNSSREQGATLRQRLMARLRGTEVTHSRESDNPPSYEDLVKSEAPPPAYYTVVSETPKLQRILKVHSLPLPWFLKKKSLEQAQVDGKSDTVVVVGLDVEGPSTSTNQQESDIWKSSASDIVYDVSIPSLSLDDDDDEPIELPSYETLMRNAVQPIMSPIHQALAGLPRPPPYSKHPMGSIVEVDQQQQTE